MTHRFTTFTCALLLLAATAGATSFVVPSDEELVGKTQAIVLGTVEGSYVQQTDTTIDTVYEIRVERSIKGVAGARNELVRVVSPGGFIEGVGGVEVAGAAHFRQGDRVLLFLTRNGRQWETTDLTLGKFRFVTSTAGDRLLVRDAEDIVGWDRAGNVHHEKLRRADEFLRFVEDRAQGRRTVAANYVVDSNDVTLPSLQQQSTSAAPAMESNAAPFPADTYTDYVSNQPIRWPNMSAGVAFYKRSTTNISGVADGGVSVIQNGLAAWNNDCASLINLSYAGQTPTASANFDATHVVEFNDPQGRVGGSWTGSGTIAITFTSFGSSHSFAGTTWWSITDADVVFQDGYPGTHSTFPTAMTHELGHGIGWRHSNQSHIDGAACNPAVEECTGTAIMNSTVVNGLGYTLQPWDQNAAQSVYPGGTCGTPCTPPAITTQPTSRTISAGASTVLSVTASGTAPLSYQWYIGASGTTTTPVSGGTSASLTVAPSATTSYWVRVSNSCGTANSGTATVTVTQQPPPSSRVAGDYNGDGLLDATVWRPSTATFYIRGVATIPWGVVGDTPVPGDYDGDGKYDVAVWRPSNGTWYIRGSAGVNQTFSFGSSGDRPVPADFDGDGRMDLAVYRPSNGLWSIRYATGTTFSTTLGGATGDVPVPADYNGDGKSDVAVFRSSTGYWYMIVNGAITKVLWGQTGDLPVPADYNGDGKDDVGIFRPSDGYWHVNLPGASVIWGVGTDIPVPGHYRNQPYVDVAVFRPSNGTWYIRSGTAFVWGQAGDIPFAGQLPAVR
jgi:hypothetical protein